MSKSVCACREAKIINENISLKPFQLLLNDETKTIFNDCFWDNQNIIFLLLKKYQQGNILIINVLFLISFLLILELKEQMLFVIYIFQKKQYV